MDHRNSDLYSHGQMIPSVDQRAFPLPQHGFCTYHPCLLNAHYHVYGSGYGYGIGIPQVQDYGFFNLPVQQGFRNYSPQLLQRAFPAYSIQDVGFPFYHQGPYHGIGTWIQQGPVNWEYLSQHYGYVPCQQNYVPGDVSSEEENHTPEESSWDDDLASEDGIENSEAWEEYPMDDSWLDLTDNYPPLEDRASGEERDDSQAWEDHAEYQSPEEDTHPDDQIDIWPYLEIDGSIILESFTIGRPNGYMASPQGETNGGLPEDTILRNLKTRTYAKEANLAANCRSDEPEICVVCQLEYEDNETLGILRCGHEYHAECIKRWLLQKNVCPLCKGTALEE